MISVYNVLATRYGGAIIHTPSLPALQHVGKLRLGVINRPRPLSQSIKRSGCEPSALWPQHLPSFRWSRMPSASMHPSLVSSPGGMLGQPGWCRGGSRVWKEPGIPDPPGSCLLPGWCPHWALGWQSSRGQDWNPLPSAPLLSLCPPQGRGDLEMFGSLLTVTWGIRG